VSHRIEESYYQRLLLATAERRTVNATLTPRPSLSVDMAGRIMKVNAYTTLDLLDGEAEGHGFTEEAFAVMNVTSPRQNPDHVSLQVELDNTQLEHLPAHAETVRLSPEEARELAADLKKHAEKVEAAAKED
jgi:hypothetical protein